MACTPVPGRRGPTHRPAPRGRRGPRAARLGLAVVAVIGAVAVVSGCGAPSASTPTAATAASGPGGGVGVAGAGASGWAAAAGSTVAPSTTGSRPLATNGAAAAPAAGPTLPGSGGTDPGSAATPTGPAPNGFTRLPDPVGRLLVTTLTGPASKVRMRVWVWLPPQYDQPAYAATRFPAVMLFPGGSGAGYNTWSGHQYGAQELIAAAARTAPTPTADPHPQTARRIGPVVFVMPQMQLTERLDTECADLPRQPKVGTFLADDVRSLVLRTFRVSPQRQAWAAAGASSGAYCATRLVFNHPDQYTAMISIDGYFHAQTALPGGKDATITATDPDHLATTRPPDVAVLLWVGSAARIDVHESAAFLARLRTPTTGELHTLPGGRHLTKDFARMMPDTLTWLTTHLDAPTPT